MTAADRQTVNLALGRIFGMISRAEQPGDVAEYERCRALVLDLHDPVMAPYPANWARDRMKGAQGD